MRKLRPSDSSTRPAASPLHQPALHESAHRHVTGEALYVDDLPLPPGSLYGLLVTSPHAHARIGRIDIARAQTVPGVHRVLLANDVPGENDIGPVVHDEPLLARDLVEFRGQAVAFVVGESLDACRDAAVLVTVEYDPLPAVLTIDDAVAQRRFLCEPHVMRRGDVDTALARCALRLNGVVESGAQDHFYLETQVAVAFPGEGQTIRVSSSTQHPSEVQVIIARVLGWGRHQITVEVPRMGGGFGGKETQAAQFAALAALATVTTGRPTKVWLNRDQDMEQTGKRHPFSTRFDAGFGADGSLEALRLEMYSNGGYSSDLSRAILDRALFHVDNGYFIPNLHFVGQAVKTNLPSNTAFRGFGGPQGMLVIEEILNRAAERLGVDPAEIRRKNFYGGPPRDRTPYHQFVTDSRLERIASELLPSSDYFARRRQIEELNQRSTHLRRGIGFGVVKFGISFTTSFLNQAGAFVVVYADGTVQLNHGGTEMGQGLHTKMIAVCAHELGVPVSSIRAMTTSTEKVPNTSATAASSGADLNGQAVRHACEAIRERLRPIAGRLLGVDERSVANILFEDGRVYVAGTPSKSITFRDVTDAAHLAQVSMSATGFYRTPDIHYDREGGSGEPFHYFANGGAVTEVEVSGLTGEYRVRRVDILHDVGDSLVPTIDLGQIEGGFVQGLGWLTCEEVIFDHEGRLLTHSPDTYKIPAVGDVPEDFRVSLLERAPQPNVIHGSKAVGEPPLMLAITAVTALRHAISAFGPPRREVTLRIPATPEAVLWAIEDARSAT